MSSTEIPYYDYIYSWWEDKVQTYSLKELTTEVIATKSARADELPDQEPEVFLDANMTRIDNARRTPVPPRVGTYRF